MIVDPVIVVVLKERSGFGQDGKGRVITMTRRNLELGKFIVTHQRAEIA